MVTKQELGNVYMNVGAGHPSNEVGTFDYYDDNGEHVHRYSPRKRMNGVLLDRLHNQRATFQDVFIDGYGWLTIPPVEQFDTYGDATMTDEDQGIQFYHNFRIPPNQHNPNAKPGYGIMNFYDLTLLLILDSFDNNAENVDETINELFFHVPIERLIVDSVSRRNISDLMFSIRVIPTDYADIAEGRVSPESMKMQEFYQSNDKSLFTFDEQLRETPILGGYVDERSIRLGVIHKPGEGNILDTPLSFKDVSIMTDVSSSTLSELRHHKKQVRNLSVATASVLTQFGELRFMDCFIQAFLNDTMPATVESPTIKPDQSRGEIYQLCILLTTGQELKLYYDEAEHARMDLSELSGYVRTSAQTGGSRNELVVIASTVTRDGRIIRNPRSTSIRSDFVVSMDLIPLSFS